MGIRRFTDLRAWQACYAFKKAVYEVTRGDGFVQDPARRRQLELSAAGPPAHIAEGFGRFSPPDFARYAVIARGALMEAQNHLVDAVDVGYITAQQQAELNQAAEEALREVSGLMQYL